MGLGAGFKEVAGEGFVGPEAGSGVLEVDDDSVKLLKVGLLGVLVGGFGAVDLHDGDFRGGVGFGGEAVGVLTGEEAVLGGEDGFEFYLRGSVGEDIDGAVSL